MDDSNYIAQYYNKKVREFGYSPQAVDWGNEYTQEIRFSVLSEAGCLNNKTILDVGCGLAGFYSFLEKNNITIDYTGIDVSDEMIKLAKVKFPHLNLLVGNFMTHEKLGTYDFVFGSGIHGLKVGDDEEKTTQAIKRMFDHCNIGMATNMLNIWYIERKKIGDYLYVADPFKIINYCRSLTDNVVFRSDYLPNDFTIYLYKKDYYDRR